MLGVIHAFEGEFLPAEKKRIKHFRSWRTLRDYGLGKENRTPEQAAVRWLSEKAALETFTDIATVDGQARISAQRQRKGGNDHFLRALYERRYRYSRGERTLVDSIDCPRA